MIGIIDYGLGNLASIRNMFKRLGIESVISSEAHVLATADKLILPGVGAFDSGMSNLKKSGLIDPLNEMVLQEKKPILGICLGVQLLTEGSDEGELPGLGWIKGRTIAFDQSRLSPTERVPNMGWRYIDISHPSCLSENLVADSRFYFVHSYHLECQDERDVIFTVTHGYSFAVGVERDNVAGVQFHPEKSHKYGMALLKSWQSSADSQQQD